MNSENVEELKIESNEDEEIKDDIEPEVKIKKFVGRNSDEKRLIVILENASLETVKVGTGFQLLNCDKHQNILRKYNRDLNNARPDITHQSLMMLLDSPLNQSGLLQIFIRTQRNVLIEVNPQIRIPRTYDRFCGLMVQLLHKLSIKASGSDKKLMKVIKNPVTDHLPSGCKKIITSWHSEKIVKLEDIVPSKEPIAIIVGAMAHGSLDIKYGDDTISISNFPLSAALVCAKLTTAFEQKWNVL